MMKDILNKKHSESCDIELLCKSPGEARKDFTKLEKDLVKVDNEVKDEFAVMTCQRDW